MKALKEPFEDSGRMNYLPYFTDEFDKLIEAAIKKIEPISNKEISADTVYFSVDGNDFLEYDCCGNEECIQKTKKDIKNKYVKNVSIEEHWTSNDVDHERINLCPSCGIPLNEFVTWCDEELEYLEENKPWNSEFFHDQAFLIYAILGSSPTMDDDIGEYAKHKGGDILKKALESREHFFQRIGALAQSVIKTIKAPPG